MQRRAFLARRNPRSEQRRAGYNDAMIILVPDSVCAELAPRAREISPEITLQPYAEDGPVPDNVNDAEGVLRWIAGKRYAALAAQGERVRWLHTASAGVDHVLTPELRAKANFTVTNSGSAFEIAISEFVLAWMLMVARRLPLLLERQRAHIWEWVPQQELHGATVGVIGLGPIGRGVAMRCKAFGMRTLGLRRRSELVDGVDEVLTGPGGLARVLAESDYLVLAAALTESTRTLLGAEELARMKPSAWIVNIARGAMIDEPALVAALQTGTIAGACLDVFAQEPLPTESPLWDLPNVYVCPHSSSGWTEGLQTRQKQLFLDNLRRFAQREPLVNIVDIARGY